MSSGSSNGGGGTATAAAAANTAQSTTKDAGESSQEHNKASSESGNHCEGCGVLCNDVNCTPKGKLCNSCFQHWRYRVDPPGHPKERVAGHRSIDLVVLIGSHVVLILAVLMVQTHGQSPADEWALVYGQAAPEYDGRGREAQEEATAWHVHQSR